MTIKINEYKTKNLIPKKKIYIFTYIEIGKYFYTQFILLFYIESIVCDVMYIFTCKHKNIFLV